VLDKYQNFPYVTVREMTTTEYTIKAPDGLIQRVQQLNKKIDGISESLGEERKAAIESAISSINANIRHRMDEGITQEVNTAAKDIAGMLASEHIQERHGPRSNAIRIIDAIIQLQNGDYYRAHYLLPDTAVLLDSLGLADVPIGAIGTCDRVGDTLYCYRRLTPFGHAVCDELFKLEEYKWRNHKGPVPPRS